MGGWGAAPPLKRDSLVPSGPLTSQGPGHTESLCRWTHCPDEPGIEATAAPGRSGTQGSGPRGQGPGGWSPWTTQCLHSGFWVGLAKRALQEEEVEVGVCFRSSFRVCHRLCLSRGPGTQKPTAPPRVLPCIHGNWQPHTSLGPPGPLSTWLPSVLAEACLLVGSGWFGHLLVNCLCHPNVLPAPAVYPWAFRHWRHSRG